VIAVTGASGFFGRALASYLGPMEKLRGLFRSRSGVSDEWLEQGHEVVFGDLTDEAALATLVDGVAVVHHLAARMSKSDPAESARVNVEGTELLARVAREAGVRRLVYVSSISVFAATESPDGVVTEETEPQNVDLLNPYSATKYGGEQALRALAHSGDGPDYTIVRPTNVWGPWGRSWFLDWVHRLERVPMVIGGNIPADLVHVDDVVHALVQAGNTEATAGEILHIGHQTITLADYGALIGTVIDRKIWRLPRPVDYLARVAVERGHRILKGDRMSMSLTRPVSYPHAKAERLIDYRPQVTLEDGLDALGRWYRETHLNRASSRPT
jgi:nucleoside-diphosphate-sugar epimerase